ncbi:MAG: class I SAM-dependent methyltransferase [Candidatus Lokiarchaeota archaeon]|nr:class I SAM-dependent methyltransferase [Candidatus Lokiarchaeota archaeon]
MKNHKKITPKYIGPDVSTKNRKMTKDEIKYRFNNETAELYSQKNPIWLPNFEFMFNTIVETLQLYYQSNMLILDLGAGTGNLSRKVLENLTDTNINLVDFSENMLKEVPNVLSNFKGQYSCVKDDIFHVDFEPNSYHAVISSFSIHHGRGELIYSKLYKSIYKWLKNPGIFLCCDVIEGDNPKLSKLNEDGWRHFLKLKKFSDKEINRILSNYHREDNPLSIRQHMKLLIESGFNSADFIWKKYNFGIYLGIKN